MTRCRLTFPGCTHVSRLALWEREGRSNLYTFRGELIAGEFLGDDNWVDEGLSWNNHYWLGVSDQVLDLETMRSLSTDRCPRKLKETFGNGPTPTSGMILASYRSLLIGGLKFVPYEVLTRAQVDRLLIEVDEALQIWR